MKIQTIHIKQFGIWHDLELPIPTSELSVFYGPNETGKTTLLHFLRGILYGFPNNTTQTDQQKFPRKWNGSLTVQHNENIIEISRQNSTQKQQPSIKGWPQAVPPEKILDELLAKTTADIYQNIFAIGLTELQQLGTLHSSKIAEQIYGQSLAPDGQQLLNSIEKARTAQQQLLNPQQQSGRLIELCQQEKQLTQKIQSLGNQQQQHQQLREQQQQITQQIADLKSRRNGMNSQLKGHRFLDHIWNPWKQLQEHKQALNQLPDIPNFPQDGIQQLAQLESDIESKTRYCNTLEKEIAQLNQQLDAIPKHKKFRKQIALIRAIIDEKPMFQKTVEQQSALQQQANPLQEKLNTALTDLGEQWTTDRLKNINNTPKTQHQLITAAQNVQSALIRRGRFRRIYSSLSDETRQQKSQLEERTKTFGSHSIDERLATTKQQLKKQHEQQKLSNRRNELQRRITTLRTQQNEQQTESKTPIPKWFFAVLTLFGLIGGLVFCIGFFTEFTSNSLPAAILSLSGLTGLGIAWGLRSQITETTQNRIEQRQRELREAELRLRELNQILQHKRPAGTEAEQLTTLATQLAELEFAARDEKKYQTERRRLFELRHRIPAVQRDVNKAQHQWHTALNDIGLDENLDVENGDIDAPFAQWQKIVTAITQQQQLEQIRLQKDIHQQHQKAFNSRIARICKQLNAPQPTSDHECLSQLDQWKQQLEQIGKSTAEQQTIEKKIQQRNHEFTQETNKKQQLNEKRSTLLLQGRAVDRDEFQKNATAAQRRKEIQQQRKQAQKKLEQAAATEPELAVVEEDLQQFDQQKNNDCIRTLDAELQEIDRDLQAVYEEHGRIKQTTDNLENNREQTELHHARAQLRQQLQHSTEQWLGLQYAQQTLQATCRHYEKESQPKTLAIASKYFRQLTDNQYSPLWTPLGQQTLSVNDAQGNVRQIEQLSRGTREQLFLAVRLAIVEQSRKQGIELPMILDDVLVNFDEQRTNAAIETLRDVAKTGQQILFFTCHQHLADRFESQSIATINLPNSAQQTAQTRLAG